MDDRGVVILRGQTQLCCNIRVPTHNLGLDLRKFLAIWNQVMKRQTNIVYLLQCFTRNDILEIHWLTLDILSLILMIGSFFLRSHTTHLAANVEPRMCWTCLFQDTQATSSGGWTRGVIQTLYAFIQIPWFFCV